MEQFDRVHPDAIFPLLRRSAQTCAHERSIVHAPLEFVFLRRHSCFTADSSLASPSKLPSPPFLTSFATAER